MIELDPRLPKVEFTLAYLNRLNVRLAELFRQQASELSPVTNIGWKDRPQAVSTAKLPSSSFPATQDFGPSGSRKEYAFAVGDYMIMQPFNVPHDAKPNGIAYIDIHWSTNGTNTNTVKWEVEVMQAKSHNQEAFPAPSTYSIIGTPSGTAWQHMSSHVDHEFTLHEPDELLLIVFKRVTNGGTDNTDRVFGLVVNVHYQSDRRHTPQHEPDFYK